MTSTPRRLRDVVVRQIVGIVSGIIFGFSLVALTHAFPRDAWAGSGVCTLIALLYVSIATHELGHLVVAIAAGMTPVSARLWPLEFVRRRRGIRVCRASSRNPWAYVRAFATDGSNGSRQVAWFALGGVAANLVAAACAIAVWRFTPADAPAWHVTAAGIFVAINVFLGIANFVPFDGVQPSDGEIFRRAIKGRTAASTNPELARHMLDVLFRADVPSVPTDTVERWQASAEVGVRAYGYYVAFYQAQLADDFAAITRAYDAFHQMNDANDTVAQTANRALLVVIVLEYCYECFRRGIDVDGASTRFCDLRSGRQLATRATLWRVEAASKMALGEHDKATVLLAKARRDANGIFAAGVRSSELSRIDDLSRALAA